jgi:hypothetical protein
MSRNLAASVRDRLKQHADAAGEDFNLTLTRYGLERLLYRLSMSRHAPSFLLKGALLFSLWYDHPHRPTRDADLLAYGPNDIDTLVATFREICAVASEDGIVFDAAAIRCRDSEVDGLRRRSHQHTGNAGLCTQRAADRHRLRRCRDAWTAGGPLPRPA